MKTSKVWAKRVAEWRASGLSSLAFCEGRDFTAFEGAVTIDIGLARVMVGRGADPTTLALVLAALVNGAAR